MTRAFTFPGQGSQAVGMGKELADAYPAAKAGFDEVEIDESLAARQPEDQWLARADWQNNNYQARLRG